MEQMFKPTALVVEDDDDQRSFVSVLLEESDMRVIECGSVEAAASAMEEAGDSLVLILADVNLAGDTGAAGLAAIARRRFPDVTVVMSSEDKRPVLPANALFMQKPWRALEVLRAAERLHRARPASP
jgi:DNA-binding NtrC family response regulator